MRSGFRNAEPGELPGGAESERSELNAETCGARTSAHVAETACRMMNESGARGIDTASIDAMSQSWAGIGDILGAVCAGTPESAVP